MPAFSTFVRCIPPKMLHNYLSRIDPMLVSELDAEVPRSEYARQLIRRYPDWDPVTRERIDRETGRVWNLRDELGQEALFNVFRNHGELDALGSGPARAMHVFLVHPKLFRLAESTKLADYGRFGQSWAEAHCDAGLTVAPEPGAVS